MDYFALGGILIQEDKVSELITIHKNFTNKWGISYPLHSNKIRGKRERFFWLRNDSEKANQFLTDLEGMLLSLPIIGIACVVHRPGYVNRYSEKHQGKPWLMCKTAFTILTERAAKFAHKNEAQLEIFFEQSGKNEDRDIKKYLRALKADGMPFDQNTSQGYKSLSADDFKKIILGEPREKTKSTPMIQIADLLLYPMVRGGYDDTYGPYMKLKETGKIIDAYLSDEEISSEGIKYSCFDFKAKK